MNEITEEQKQDIEDRKKQFMDRYEELVQELQVDFAQFPIYMPIGPNTFGTVIQAELMDKKYLSVPSPIQA